MVDVVDYFTKWAEVEALLVITNKKIKSFMLRSIICRYGAPYKLITYSGLQFESKEFHPFCDQYSICKSFSTVMHLQRNGQVEVVNKTLKLNVQTKLENFKGV